ncbi:MAG: T9SS type A sorting domain-containing protein [Bacteroidetes bacterium]|nr:T9SS type A sorting domain-containing protein [Bacteroidota bacterium]
MKYFLLLATLLFFTHLTDAQTTLSPGDIMFIGLNSDPTGASGADEVDVLFLEPVTSGTVIYFTDFGYIGNSFPFFQQSTNNGCSSGTGQSADGIIKWTATSAVSAGTQLVIGVNLSATGMTSNIGSLSLVAECPTVTGSGMALTATGEVVHAFQGTINGSNQPSSITMLASINYQSVSTPNWTSVTQCATSQNISADPGTGYEVEYTTHFDDGYYSGTMSGTKASLQAAILNNSNWTMNDATGYTFPISGSFSVTPTSTTWNGSTWSNGSPTSSLDAVIASTTAPGNFSCKNLTINSGVSLATGTSNTTTIYGDVTNSGNGFTGTGTLAFSKTGTQALNGTAFSFNGTVTVASGATLTTNDKLTLSSNSTNTGRIGNSAGTISGNVTVERYIPGGRRAFRFFAHPFSTSLALTQLTDDIDITGSGGSTNGFTTTGTNSASSFWYDVTAGDNTTTGNNPGWTEFTSTNGSGANAWNRYQAARILVRGAKGEGLTSASYTPSAATLDMSGVVNQGNQAISLTKGSSTNFILVGNPFPSQVNMDALSGTNLGSAFYIWNAQQGTKGGYTSYPFGTSSFILPSCASFVTTLSANGNILFEESDKSSSTSGTMFKTTGTANMVQLRLEDSTIFWDRLLLNFDDNAMATVDFPDAPKLYNPDMTFYTRSADDSMLSIDARPYKDSSIIPLGLYCTLKKSFKIIAADFNMPAGTKLFLQDKYLSKTEEITGSGYEYWFEVTSDTATWGNNRFELNTQGKPTGISAANNNSKLRVKLVPNPATDKLTVYTEGAEGNIRIAITNMTGVKVVEQSSTASVITVTLTNVADGIYIVTIENDNETITQTLIKQ